MTPEGDPRREEARQAQESARAQPQQQPDAQPEAQAQSGSSGDFGDRGRGEAYIPLPQAPAAPPKKRGWLAAVTAAVLALAAVGVMRHQAAAPPTPMPPPPAAAPAQAAALAFTSRDFDAAATAQAQAALKGPGRDAELAAALARRQAKQSASPEQLAALLAAETPRQRAVEAIAGAPEGLRQQVVEGSAGFYTFHIQSQDAGGDVVDVVVDGVPVARVVTSRAGAVIAVPLDPKTQHTFTETLVFSRDRRVYVKDGPQSAPSGPVGGTTNLGIASSAGESRSGAVGQGQSASWSVRMGGGAAGTLGSGGL